MTTLNKKQLTIIAVLALIALAVAFIGFKTIQTHQNYGLIERAVAAQPYAAALTENNRSSTSECYPSKNEKPVCLQIRYTISQEKCPPIKNTDTLTDSGNNCLIESGADTYEDGNFRYSTSNVNGKQMLYVLFVSRN